MPTTLMPVGEYILPVWIGLPIHYDPRVPRLGVRGEVEFGKVPPSGAAAFAVFRELTADEFARFHAACDDLAKYRAARIPIHVARSSAGEFEASMEEVVATIASGITVTRQWLWETVVRVNQRFLNFQTAMRTYDDHTRTRLSRKYGDTSDELKSYKGAASAEYDGNPAYRFMCRLRNYTQHLGMPLGRITGGSTLLPDQPPGGLASHAIDFFFEKAELLNNFDGWGPHVTPELEAKPAQFPLRAYVGDAMASLDRIEKVLVETDQKAAAASLTYLQVLAAELGPGALQPCVYTHLEVEVGSNPPKYQFDMMAFPIEDMAEMASASKPVSP